MYLSMILLIMQVEKLTDLQTFATASDILQLTYWTSKQVVTASSNGKLELFDMRCERK